MLVSLSQFLRSIVHNFQILRPKYCVIRLQRRLFGPLSVGKGTVFAHLDKCVIVAFALRGVPYQLGEAFIRQGLEESEHIAVPDGGKLIERLALGRRGLVAGSGQRKGAAHQEHKKF